MATATARKSKSKKITARAGKTGGARKRVYFFGAGKAEGKAEQKPLLGGKGANLAEMTSAGLPVPPGFTITTESLRPVLQDAARSCRAG